MLKVRSPVTLSTCSGVFQAHTIQSYVRDTHNSLHTLFPWHCILSTVLVRITGQNLVENINHAESPDPAHNVELGRCDDDSILTVRAFLTQIDEFGGQFGDRCDTTPTFSEFCEATVRCSFTQTEFRAAVRDVCGADYDQAQMTFIYNCLPGTQPFTETLLTFVLL